MRRIKLIRPPPVSSETVKDIVSGSTDVDSLSKNRQSVQTESRTGDVSALDISTDVEKYPSDRRLITSKDTATDKKDTQRVVKHKRTVVCNADEVHNTAAPRTILQSSSNILVASDASAKKPKKKEQCGNVVTDTAIQILSSGDDYKQASCDEQHVVATTDNAVRDCQDNTSATHRCSSSKKSNKNIVGKTWSDGAESVPSSSAYGTSSKRSSDSSFCDKFSSTHLLQKSDVDVEHQQSEGDRKPPGLLLDEVLKGFLVKKLAVIESERTGTNVNCQEDSVEAVVHNEPKDFPPLPKVRSSKRSRRSAEQQRDLEHLPAKLKDKDRTLHRCDKEYTEDDCNAGYAQLHAYNWPHTYVHRGHHHVPPSTMHDFTDSEDTAKHNFDAEVNSIRRGHRRHVHSARHSLHAKKHLITPEKKDRHTEYRHQSYELPKLERSQPNLQKTFDCIEQIRHFVSHTTEKFSHPVGQNHAPLESYLENNDSETHDRERRKSGSITSHHHLKKQKSAKHITDGKMCCHKHVIHRHRKKSLQTTKNVHDMLTNKKHSKHKHKHHHSKKIFPDVPVDCLKLDKSERLHHVEQKDSDDTFSKSRSLSPLGLHRKHHKKRKKKSKESVVPQISAQNVSLLPEKSEIQYDKISSDEEFIPMKVQKNDDSDTATLKVPHKMDMPKYIGVEQGQTSSKSTAALKFLKVSGKRPKRRTHISDCSTSAEVSKSSEHVHNSNVSVEDHPIQAAVAEPFQMVTDAATDPVTSEKTVRPSDVAGQDYTGQIGTSHEVPAPVSSVSIEQANSCIDADGRGVLQMKLNADQVSDEVCGERRIFSTDEVSTASQKFTVASVDSGNLTESFGNDKMLQLGANQQQNTMEESNDVAQELPTQDSDCTSKIVLSDNMSDTTTGEELKSRTDDSHAANELCKSVSNESEKPAEFHPDIEPDAVCDKTQDKNSEKDKCEEPVLEEHENVADQHSVSGDTVSPAINSPLQQNQTTVTEVVATLDQTSGEDDSVTNTVSSTKTVQSCNADEKVGENCTSVPSNLMGPPLALPPSLAFKKPLPVMKMSLRITDTSADIISSGVKKNDKVKKAGNSESREEGNQVVSVADYLTDCSYM